MSFICSWIVSVAKRRPRDENGLASRQKWQQTKMAMSLKYRLSRARELADITELELELNNSKYQQVLPLGRSDQEFLWPSSSCNSAQSRNVAMHVPFSCLKL